MKKLRCMQCRCLMPDRFTGMGRGCCKPGQFPNLRITGQLLAAPKLRKRFLHQVRRSRWQQTGYATDLPAFIVRADIDRVRAIKFVQLHAIHGVQPPVELLDEYVMAVSPYLRKELGRQLLPGSGTVLPHDTHPFVLV